MTAKSGMTMDDIARLANVSKPTVSRALSDSPLVNKDTKDHVLSVARAHGYAINRNAQKLRHKRTNTIAVSLDYQSHDENHITDPFIFELLAGVSQALGDAAQDLLLCAPTHNDADAFHHILSSRAADGFIVLGQGHREPMLAEVAAAGAPLVVWGARAVDTPYCVVGSDNFRGGQLAGRHFIDAGRSRFLFVGDPSFREIYWRRAGLIDAIQSSDPRISIDDVVLTSFSYECAFQAACRFLRETDRLPDAVFACSDTAAMAFISAFRHAGMEVGADVSFVGYNDIPPAAYFSPQLTTVRQDKFQAGRLLVAKMLESIEGLQPASTTIRTELIVRET